MFRGLGFRRLGFRDTVLSSKFRSNRNKESRKGKGLGFSFRVQGLELRVLHQ